MDLSQFSFEEIDSYLLSQQAPIIHQIWFWTIQPFLKAKKDFQKLKIYRDTWTFYNPHFLHVIWNEKHATILIKTFYPEFYDMYKGYRYEIQRCDAVRYFILHRYGGIYADMDYKCLKSFETLKLTQDVYFVKSPNRDSLSNSLIISRVRNSQLWKRVFIELDKVHDKNRMYGKHVVVMYSTGPAFLTKIMESYKYRYPVGYLPHEQFHPLSLKVSELPEDMQDIYAIHFGHGSWEETDSKILIVLYISWPIILSVILILLGPQLFLCLFK